MEFIENLYKIKCCTKKYQIYEKYMKIGYEKCMKINWTKGCLEENKKSFENGAPIFEYSFNDKWMNRRKIGLFSIYDVLIEIKQQFIENIYKIKVTNKKISNM